MENADMKGATTTAIAAVTRAMTVVDNADGSQGDDSACVVCFKNTEIYSIGDCDHPVCYECSTRMRVLCQQNECPICRHVLSKVLFTYEKLPYRQLEAKNRSEFYSKKYRIGFYTSAIQQKFFELLDHPCPNCETPPYRTFQGLRNHVRKEHDLYYCDLCVDNLKIFTFERRCYTVSELNLHRTKGDPDNRSHRGHPLCEYCNKRYLDRDELFRHLRREHYFCHFCDAEGCNEFYKDYDALADHFRRDHFLCEEGKCATEQFVGAFRSEIDYKAHVANVHGKTMNKQQAKQTRTLQLEITLGPRGRAGQSERDVANLRSRSDDSQNDYALEDLLPSTNSSTQRQQLTIDAKNEEEFPSLGGGAAGPNISLTRPPPPSMRTISGTAGLARTKENFPALGGGTVNGGGGGGGTMSNHHAPPVASVIRKPPSAATGAIARSNASTSGSNGMVIHVSNRPASQQNTNGANKKTNKSDFPALPTGGKNKKNIRSLEEDMINSSDGMSLSNVAAKHRTLMADDYVSVANPTNFNKLQMVQKEENEAKARREVAKLSAPKLTTADFPSLGGGGGGGGGTNSNARNGASGATWLKQTSDKKQRELENRKAKVAAAPVLTSKNNNNKGAATNNNNNSTSKTTNSFTLEQATRKEKKPKEKKSKHELQQQQQQQPQQPHTQSQGNKAISTKYKEKNNNNNNDQNQQNENSTISQNGIDAKKTCAPPPGFKENALKPPPGFLSNVTVNSVAKLPNNMTFTSSLGENYNIVPTTQTYTDPPDAAARNQKLVDRFNEALKTTDALEEFRFISQKFREGVYKTQAYYEHCRAALENNFDQVFPELLVLLPDISKQQELFLAHTQYLNTLSPNQRKAMQKLEVCNNCKQVLLASDFENHKKLHESKTNFPALNQKAAPSKNLAGNRK